MTCNRDEEDNAIFVNKSTEAWLENLNLTCFYQEEIPTNVVAIKPTEYKYLYYWLMFLITVVAFITFIVFRIRGLRQHSRRNQDQQGIPYFVIILW